MNQKIQKYVKRSLDVIGSIFVLVLFLPLWILVAITIKYTSPGPIFFTQERPGLGKKKFKVYKFRTMKLESEQMIKGQEVSKDDKRITTVGKYLRRSKIDEIPQLLNVLKGEMSLVGPRPERLASLDDYTDDIARRLDVKPGMTGLAQVNGNIYISLGDRYKFDIYYVDNFSLWLDFRILLRTIGVLILGEDQYVDRCLVDITEENIEIAALQKETIPK